jgi:hypothetical protein
VKSCPTQLTHYQVLEAAYEQGLRNGRREVFDEFDRMKQRPELKHRNPGRPTKPARKPGPQKAAARKTAKTRAKKSSLRHS